ncbi:MAG: anti-sigma factor domain-containing protein [Peptococcaceae bacterium]|nr:anti-sigma factor domain-containing protein [Peptococcaceae bacterium]
MAKIKGVVAQIEKNNFILITPQGEFVKARAAGRKPNLGQEIEGEHFAPAWRKLALAAAAVLLIGLMLPFYPLLTASAQPAAYVSLDINPSVELGVNKQGSVIEVKAFNQAGKALLDGPGVAQTNVYQAVQNLVSKAIQAGYIQQSASNLLVISYTGDGSYKFNQQELNNLVNNLVTAAKLQVQVLVTPTTLAEHKQALAQQMSQGQYALVQAAKVKGLKLDTGLVRNNGIEQALHAQGITIAEVAPAVTWMGPPINTPVAPLNPLKPLQREHRQQTEPKASSHSGTTLETNQGSPIGDAQSHLQGQHNSSGDNSSAVNSSGLSSSGDNSSKGNHEAIHPSGHGTGEITGKTGGMPHSGDERRPSNTTDTVGNKPNENDASGQYNNDNHGDH